MNANKVVPENLVMRSCEKLKSANEKNAINQCVTDCDQ